MKIAYLVGFLLLLSFAAGSVSAQGQTGIQAQVLGSFFLGLDDSPPYHSVVGGSLRLYEHRRISFVPEFQFAHGFGPYNSGRARAYLFIPNIAVDVGGSQKIRPYLIAGLGFTRYVEYDVQYAMNVSFGGGARVFVTPKVFVSPEFRIGMTPIVRATVGLGYVFQTGPEAEFPETRDGIPSHTQHPIFEIAPGFGYALGSGAEDPAPDVPAVTFAATLWLSRDFGVSVSTTRGVGQDLYPEPIITPSIPDTDVYAREYRGSEDLRYYRVMMRYRRPLGDRFDMNIGVGLMVGGSVRQIVWMHAPNGPVDVSNTTSFGGLTTELLFGRRLAPHLVMKSGVAFDFNGETNILLPTLQMVVDF